MTDPQKPKHPIAATLWWIYVALACFIILMLARKNFPTYAGEYRLTMYEFMALCLAPAFAFSIPGFLFRRLNLGHVSLAFVIFFFAGVISVFVAKRETELKIKAEANRVASKVDSLLLIAGETMELPAPLPTPTPTVTPTATPTPTPTPVGPTPKPTPTPTGPTPTPTVTPTPTPIPYDAVLVPKELTTQATYELETIRATYQRDIAALNFSHLLTPGRLAADKGMADGLKATEQALALNETFHGAARTWLEAIPANIDGMSVPEPERTAMRKAYGGTLAKSRGMIENAWIANKKLATELGTLLAALKDSTGWSVVKGSDGKDKFDFADTAIATAFIARVAKIDALTVDQQQTMTDTMTALRDTITATFTAVPPPTPTPTATPVPTEPPATTPSMGPVVTPAPVPVPTPAR